MRWQAVKSLNLNQIHPRVMDSILCWAWLDTATNSSDYDRVWPVFPLPFKYHQWPPGDTAREEKQSFITEWIWWPRRMHVVQMQWEQSPSTLLALTEYSNLLIESPTPPCLNLERLGRLMNKYTEVKDTKYCLRHRQPLAADGGEDNFGVRVTKVSCHHL